MTIVQNGTLVTPGGMLQADLAMEDGKNHSDCARSAGTEGRPGGRFGMLGVPGLP